MDAKGRQMESEPRLKLTLREVYEAVDRIRERLETIHLEPGTDDDATLRMANADLEVVAYSVRVECEEARSEGVYTLQSCVTTR